MVLEVLAHFCDPKRINSEPVVLTAKNELR